MAISESRLDDAMILVGAWDLSGDHNEIKLAATIDTLEYLPFQGGSTRLFKQALGGCDVEGQGYADFDDDAANETLFSLIASTERIFTIGHTNEDGAVAFNGKAIPGGSGFSLTPAELGTFSLSLKANQHARGKLILPPTARTASSGTGTVTLVGDLAAAEKMCLALHVIEFDGTSLDVTVYSNDTQDTVTPTSRHAFTTVSAVGSDYAEVSGAITDTYWYATFSFTGTSFTAALSACIR